MSPRTGRPKSDNPKDVRFSIRLDAETYSQLLEYSTANNISVAKAIRLAITELLDINK